jgi:iron complex transport system ATP-binding protein
MPPYHNETGKSPLLEFRNVTVIKEGKKVLDSIDVTVREGEHIAILGPNGAGKSSFIKTITREYYPANRGNVIFRIWGRDGWNVFDLRALLGVVSNDLQFTFTREITAREAVISGFFSSVGLFSQKVTCGMEEKTDRIIEFLEISHLQDRLMTELSSGEARRFLIARALVHDPKALILDEPTNSLDLHALHTFRQTLRKVARSGTGIILVSHNLPDIIPEISRVILMKEGRFWNDGKKEEVLTDSHIGALFAVPGVRVREEEGYYYATGY